VIRGIDRRALLRGLGMIPIAGAVTRAKGAAGGAGSVHDGLPLLARNEGRWEGTYTHVRPDGELVDRHDFIIEVTLSADNARAYRQESHYRWPDGRTRDLVFEAAYADGALTWDNGRIHGRLREISGETIYLTFGFHDTPAIRCHEMIQVSPDGAERGRSWLWYEGNRLERYTLVDERRVPG